VKSKNRIRNNSTESRLYDDIRSDLSVQAYVLHHVLGRRFSGRCFVVYLDRDYVCLGQETTTDLLKIDMVSSELSGSDELLTTLSSLDRSLSLSKEQFDALYPWR